jgi:acyl-CoA oxidase
MTVEDVVNLTPKFWKLHTDLFSCLEGGSVTLISIQYNLFVGTVAPFAQSRPELGPVLQRALNFDVSSVFAILNPRKES